MAIQEELPLGQDMMRVEITGPTQISVETQVWAYKKEFPKELWYTRSVVPTHDNGTYWYAVLERSEYIS